MKCPHCESNMTVGNYEQMYTEGVIRYCFITAICDSCGVEWVGQKNRVEERDDSYMYIKEGVRDAS